MGSSQLVVQLTLYITDPTLTDILSLLFSLGEM